MFRERRELGATVTIAFILAAPCSITEQVARSRAVDAMRRTAQVPCVHADLQDAIAAAYAQRWDAALDLLLRAAEAEDAEAQAQLAVLAGELSAQDWRRLRAGIDPVALITPPLMSRLTDRAEVGAARGFAPPAFCTWLIDRARDRLEPSKVNVAATGQTGEHTMRTAHTCWFGADMRDMVLAVMQTRAARLSGLPIEQHEAPSVISYLPGQQFALHVDFIDPSTPGFEKELASLGQRVATIVTYLNDDFEGAATQFPRLGIEFRGGVGDAIAFSNVRPDGQPARNTAHAGLPPTRGRKWVLSQWLRDRVQPPG